MRINRPQSKQPIPQDAKLVFKGKVFDVYQWQQKLFDGSYTTFEKIKRVDTAMVIPVTREGRIVMGEEEQPGKGKFIDFLGGRVDRGEDPLEAAKRELLEEAGYAADKLILWGYFQPVSKIEWVVYMFVAKGCVKVQEPRHEPGEKIRLRFFTFDQFIKQISTRQYESKEVLLKLLHDKTLVVVPDKKKVRDFKDLLLS